MTITAKYGGKRIEHLVKMAKEIAAYVGLPKGTADHPTGSGQSIVQIAYWNEYGTKTSPSRPFLRTTMRDHRHYTEEVRRIMKKTLHGGNPIPQFKLLGVRAAGDVQNKIANNEFARNAPSTIARKSTTSGVKDKPLIDTGAMRQAIRSTVEVHS